MTKRNRNIKNIFIKLQFSTNIMANEVKTPIQNYFEKVYDVRRTTDDRRQTTDDGDGRQVMRIAHMTLWVR